MWTMRRGIFLCLGGLYRESLEKRNRKQSKPYFGHKKKPAREPQASLVGKK
jgi:hypothetical protein